MATKKMTSRKMKKSKKAKAKEMTQRGLYSLTTDSGADSGIVLMDIPRGLSLVNRKLFEAGRNYRIRLTVLHIDAQSNPGTYLIGTLPNNWVTRNAYRLGKATFESQQNAAGIARGKWSDFRPYFNESHWSGSAGFVEAPWCSPTGVEIPLVANIALPPQTQAQNGEWQRAQLFGTTTDDALLGDVANVSMLSESQGDPSTGWVSVGLIAEYGKMRTTVQRGSGDTSADLTDSFFLTNEEASAALKLNVEDYGQAPVYQGALYYGSQALDQGTFVLGDDLGMVASIGDRSFEGGAPTQRIVQTDWFDAPLGYVWLSALDQGTGSEQYRIFVEVAPGDYNGVNAPEL